MAMSTSCWDHDVDLNVDKQHSTTDACDTWILWVDGLDLDSEWWPGFSEWWPGFTRSSLFYTYTVTGDEDGVRWWNSRTRRGRLDTHHGNGKWGAGDRFGWIFLKLFYIYYFSLVILYILFFFSYLFFSKLNPNKFRKVEIAQKWVGFELFQVSTPLIIHI